MPTPIAKLFLSGNFFSMPHSGIPENLQPGNLNPKKKFTLGYRSRQIFMSRCMYADFVKVNKLKTFILTFRRQPKDPNEVLNRFITNLRKNYGLTNYAYTLELTKKRVWHYHFLVDMPFIKVKKLNGAWCKARGDYSPNALRCLEVVKSTQGAAMYAAKYFTKFEAAKEAYKRLGTKKRLWNTSSGLHGKELVEIIDYEDYMILKENAKELRENDFNISGFVDWDTAITMYQSIMRENGMVNVYK